jgi:ABC-2 type transport system permease protein
MNPALWKRSIGESQWLLLGCAAVLFGFCWTFVWLTSLFEASRFQQILEIMRPEIEKFSPVPIDHMLSYTGRIAMVYDHPLVIFTVAVWAIARGSDAVSGSLGRGTLEMVLGQPVSRRQFLTTQIAVSFIGVALLSASAWLGIWCGVKTVSIKQEPASWKIPGVDIELRNFFGEQEPSWVPMSEKADPRHLLPATVNLFSLGVFLAGLATLMSSWDRYRWRTIGIVSGFFVVQMIVKIVALSANHLHWLIYLTFLGAYEPLQLTSLSLYEPQQLWTFALTGDQGEWTGAGPVACNLTLLFLGMLSYAGSLFVFCRRDLPAPL